MPESNPDPLAALEALVQEWRKLGAEASDTGWQANTPAMLLSHARALAAVLVPMRQQLDATLRERILQADDHERSLLDLLRFFEPAISSRIPPAAEVLEKMKALRQQLEAQQKTIAELRVALVSAEQFLYPEIPRGPAINGWSNTLATVQAELGAGEDPHGH